MMATCFSTRKSSNSKLKRLSFLPRIGIFVDFAGIEFTLRHAPNLETIYNVLKEGKPSAKKILETVNQQISEIKISEFRGAISGKTKEVKRNLPKTAKKKKSPQSSKKRKARTVTRASV